MSASPITRPPSESKAIPSRRMLITDPSQLPHNYSSTPGGSLYSTTPGGMHNNSTPNICQNKYFYLKEI